MAKIVDQLFKKPKRDKGIEVPHFSPCWKNFEQQADLLFLPEDLYFDDEDDGGYRYALVVADVGTRLTDAEPIKDKKATTVLKAFKTIYKRGILSVPKQLDVDMGSEFKGVVKKWFEDQDVVIHVAAPHRHRQQGIVERKNQIIGEKISKRQVEEELQTGEPATQWTDDLPDIIKEMNKQSKKTAPKPLNLVGKQLDKFLKESQYKFSADNKALIPEGTKVRVALDAPKSVTSGKKLFGKFRSTDVRWNTEPNIIKEVIVQPSKPPLYLVNDENGDVDHRQAYTRNQLQIVRADEKQPSKEAIKAVGTKKGKQVFKVKKIVDKKKVGKQVFYRVRWLGFKPEDDTWESRKQLLEDAPKLLKEYEDEN